MLKDKILAELRKKYPGLAANILGLVADKLAAKVTEESQIEGSVAELENLPISLTDYGKLLQQEGDRRVTEAEKKWKEKKTSGSDPKDDDEKTDPKPSDDALARKLADIEKRLAELNQKETQAKLTEKLHAKLKEKKIPVHMAKGVTLEKEEDLDSIVGTIETEFAAFKQELVNEGLMSVGSPVGGSTTLKTDNVDEDIKAWAGKKEDKK